MSRRPDPLAQVSDFDIRLLKIYRSVVECGGFSAADTACQSDGQLFWHGGLLVNECIRFGDNKMTMTKSPSQSTFMSNFKITTKPKSWQAVL